MKNTYLTLACIFFSICLFSQETPNNFTLEEAIDFALKNNRTAKNAVRDVKAAEQQKRETTATGLPQIDGSIDYQNWLKQQVSLLPGEITGGEPGTFNPITFSPKQ